MKLGINGFGRIGRQVFRIAFPDEKLEVVHVNDLTDARTLAHLLQFDTTYGPWSRQVSSEDRTLVVGSHRITVTSEPDPGRIPWRDRGVDVVLESTGRFRTRATAGKHLEAGARKVLVTAPGKGPLDGDFVLGVNDELYDRARHDIISIGSCTTNCLAPVAKVLHAELGIEHGFMTTVHAYTASQNLQDGPHKDLRRARASCENIIPTSTGAAKAIGSVLPELAGKLDGLAMRVPVICGSIVDLTCRVGKATTAAEVNAAMRRWAEDRMKGILYVQDAPIVSRDVVGSPFSAIVSPQDTAVLGDRLVKVLAWYDNEWGFSQRCVDMMARMV